MSFENIIGNEKVKELLNRTVNSNNILHSYMFVGIDGIGKKLFAIEFAKMISCEAEITIIDKEYDKEKKKEKNSIGIEQIRYLNSKIYEKPVLSDRKVYIINNSDLMTKEAQNCLLKTLEEPPSFATIILITSNESKILNTIKSRCIKISFNKISDVELEKYVKQNIDSNVKKEDLSYYNGSLGKVYKVYENKEEYNSAEQIIKKLDNSDLLYILNNSEVLYKQKDLIYDLLDYINILLLKSNVIKKIKCVNYVEEAKKRLASNSNYDMTIDNLLMKMWEEVNN